MSEFELRKCPFCGGQASIVPRIFNSHDKDYAVMCNRCRTNGKHFDTKNEAANWWNSRIALQRLEYKNFDITGLVEWIDDFHREAESMSRDCRVDGVSRSEWRGAVGALETVLSRIEEMCVEEK